MQELIQVWFQGLFEGLYEFFDPIFIFFSLIGEELIFMLILAILFWAVNKRLAVIMSCSTVFSLTTNGFIKEIAKIERPISNENIRHVSVENIFINTNLESYSFPSGHAQTAGSLFGTLGFYMKKPKVWIICIVSIILVCLSRIYLGVHWPLDVAVGAVLGFSISYFVSLLYNKFESKKFFIYLGISVGALIASFFVKNTESIKNIGAACGLGIGLAIECKWIKFDEKVGTWYQKIIRVVVGLVFVLIIKEGLKYLFRLIGDYNFLHFIRYVMIAIGATVLYPMLFKWFRAKFLSKKVATEQEEKSQDEASLEDAK